MKVFRRWVTARRKENSSDEDNIIELRPAGTRTELWAEEAEGPNKKTILPHMLVVLRPKLFQYAKIGKSKRGSADFYNICGHGS